MKNANIAIKFTVLVVPLLLISVLVVIMYATQSISIFNSSKTTFHDELLASTSSVVNADRDFYQAEIAEKELYLSGKDVTADKKKELIALS